MCKSRVVLILEKRRKAILENEKGISARKFNFKIIDLHIKLSK